MAMGKPTISVCEQKTLEVLRFTCPTWNLLQNKETRKGGWHQCYTTDKNILLWLLCVKVTTKHLSFLTKGGCEGQKWHLVRITEVSQKSLCKSVQVAQPWSEDLTLSSDLKQKTEQKVFFQQKGFVVAWTKATRQPNSSLLQPVTANTRVETRWQCSFQSWHHQSNDWK